MVFGRTGLFRRGSGLDHNYIIIANPVYIERETKYTIRPGSGDITETVIIIQNIHFGNTSYMTSVKILYEIPYFKKPI